MSKYFELSGSWEPKVIGVNNGVCQGNIIWKKFEHKESEKKIMNYFSLKKLINNGPAIEPIDFEIEYVEAYKGAKMTDFFMFSPALYGISFFVTKKVKDVLSKFKLPLSAFIPVTIFHGEIKYEYYAFYIPVHYRDDSVDFSKSIFFKGSAIVGKTFIQFKNAEEYKNFKSQKSAEKIKFNKKFDNTLDLFETIWGGGYFISENLKVAIEEVNITGILIREPKSPELIFE